MSNNNASATFGAGCFWCVEGVFQRLKGVTSVIPGYAGGQIKNPTYKEVCAGNTGHAEVARIEFDPHQISFKELLEVFFKTHDPTTLNRQGNDVGTQYRSVIFYHDEGQKKDTLQFIDGLQKAKYFEDPIVTEVKELPEFYKAEDYHHNYFNENGNEGYCRFVIAPKIEKMEREFANKLK